MGLNIRNRKLFYSFVAILFLMFFKINHAQEINIGYLDFNNFVVYDEDGFRSGYVGELFNNLEKSSKTHYNLTYGTWRELEKKLDNKELDIILAGRKDKKRLEKYEYSNLDIGVSKGIIYSLPDSDYFYDDFSKYENKTIGYYCPSLVADFREYLKEKKINCKEKQYFSKNELRKALDNKEVDLIIIEYMRYDNELKKVGEFSTRPLFAISLKDSSAMENFNKDYEKLFMKKYNIRSYLYEKYYKSNVENKFVLTRKEYEYLNKLDKITVAVRDMKPLNWKDKITGKPTGVYINALREIGNMLKIDIEFILINKDMDKNEILEKYDYFLDSIKELSKDKEDFFTEDSIFKINYVYIKDRNNNIDFVKNLNVGMLNSNKEISKAIKKKNKNYKIFYFEDAKNMADAVVSGSIDKALINEMKIPYLFKDLKYKDLTTIYLEDIYGNLKLVSKNNNHLLQSSINKVINYLGQDKIYRVALSNLDVNDNSSVISNFFEIYGLKVGIIILIIVLWLLILYILQRNRIYKKLSEAKQEAEYANKAKSNFLASMSHDMKTPISSIMGMSDFGLEECKGKECKSYFKQIKESSRYLLTLLNDILDLQNIENDKINLELKNVNLKKIIEDVGKVAEYKIKEKEIEFQIKNYNENHFIKVDEKRLKQIIINVLSNAIKYTHFQGTIRWRNSLEIKKNGNYIYTCIIEDNGIGISEEFQKNMMYKSFTQEYNKLLNNKGGTGLGLSITKKILDNINGTIECISEINKGTKFIITIPFERANKSEALKLKEESEKIETSLKNKKILICEDIEINRLILTKILNSLGIIVEEAEDGKIAVEKAKENKYDGILMDIRMPVMDGLEAARKIREFNTEIPIIAISANVSEEDIIKSLDSGMDGHLGKPIEKNKLKNILKKYLK
ncbi:MAG: response regulator [Fusobacterium sp. JB021]|nr:response regulator [Fusobacterium sp. JB021]